MPEAWLVYCPSPAIARLKIVGNIIELNKPTRMIVHIAKEPLLKTVSKTSKEAIPALKARAFPAATFCMAAAPTNRPTMAPPQYSPTYLAAWISSSPAMASSEKKFTRKLPIETSAPT